MAFFCLVTFAVVKLELELEDNYNTQKLKYLIGVQKQYRTFAQDYMYAEVVTFEAV